MKVRRVGSCVLAWDDKVPLNERGHNHVTYILNFGAPVICLESV